MANINFINLIILIMTMSVYGADDFWVVWRQRAFNRCLQLKQSKEQCEIVGDSIEEQMMETIYPLYSKLDKTNDEIVATSLKIPYVLVGQRVVDKYLNLLINEKIKSEDEITKQMFWETTTFIMDCIYGKEGPVWKKIKEDAFWDRKESKEYLKSIGIDLSKISIDESIEKEENEKEIEKRKNEMKDDDDWGEYDQFKEEV
ncbi:hypothetical protein KM1_095530 [Entamoeba histolytica HM-3:IMSS]|uniref:Uncharacterized protein n=1 Tax=Entamoeba histolytica HM-3:IMSS TaxID=885315 RepID=M7VVH8_ENTHI|nr:hypothetical protein KM1_095530 [Entamoeba histolytica HM-3:IMSS]